MTRDLHVHFQFEFTESILEVRRDLVKVDGEMGAKMGVKMGVEMGAKMGVKMGVSHGQGNSRSITRNQLNTTGYSTKFYRFSSSLAIPIKMPANHPHVHCTIKGIGFSELLHVG